MMWLVRLALRRPISVAVMSLLMTVLGLLAFTRMDVDIFPAIKLPVVLVVWTYPGLSAEDMERRIVWITERSMTSMISEVSRIESQSIPGLSIIKAYFNSDADLGISMGEITSAAASSYRNMPDGTQLPYIFSYDAANVPVAQVNISSDTVSAAGLYDYGLNFLRFQFLTIPGFSSPPPVGGAIRDVMVNLNPDALYAYGLSPADVGSALADTSIVIPSGQARIGNYTYNVDLNMSPKVVSGFDRLPIAVSHGIPIHLGDVAPVSDSHQPITNVVKINGQSGSSLLVIKHAGASTLKVVDEVRRRIPLIQQSAPPGIKLSLAFDQSIFVRSALREVVSESLIAAALVALMALVFLGSPRSMLIVIISIPLSILTAMVGLQLAGQTLNIMSLGGLALAVGMLVDDATVEIENIHRNHAMGKPLLVAILEGAAQIATPTLVGTLAVCIVFFPVVMLSGVARYLFTPLALAVVLAMLTSYLLSRTLVTSMAHRLLPQHHDEHAAGGLWNRFVHGFNAGFERFGQVYRRALERFVACRRLTLSCVALMIAASLVLVTITGEDFFPPVDTGMMKLHVRLPSGTRIERTELVTDQIQEQIRRIIPKAELDSISVSIGTPLAFTLAFYQSDNTGEQDADILIQLQPKHGPTARYQQLIRTMMATHFPNALSYFQDADIIGQVLNFGLSAPIDIQIGGRNLQALYALASRLRDHLQQVPGVADLRIPEPLDYPALDVDVDRDRALELGATEKQVASALLTALSGDSLIQPAWWLDDRSGVNYEIVAEMPKAYLTSIQQLANLPVMGSTAQNSGGMIAAAYAPSADPPPSQVLANIATIRHGVDPAVVDHSAAERVMDVDLGVAGRDLGSVADEVDRAIARLGKLPKGVRINVLGQSKAMRDAFSTLEQGIALAAILVYLLMAANFQSWMEPLIIMTAVPGALAGALWALVLTHTTINVESLMGAIMAVGVAVANGNLLISFANELREQGQAPLQAALVAARTRLRPILMTALAMVLGMLPMALGLGKGSELNAPLGRAVIGGLLAATAMTLFVVPAVYASISGHRKSTHERDLEIAQADAVIVAERQQI
ncbi:MAG TPA: efflux RND transporter permease subunit [Candidatus Binataceae bacterium]|nr:efflux RND transporter permease subunit [Candidatus Binataceae bacterium]